MMERKLEYWKDGMMEVGNTGMVEGWSLLTIAAR
jgi:hypothetical protein